MEKREISHGRNTEKKAEDSGAFGPFHFFRVLPWLNFGTTEIELARISED
jgi:hypothetical protein